MSIALERKPDSLAFPALDACEVRLFGTRFHGVTLREARAIISRWIDSTGSGCHVVVTPNVDHVVRMQTNAAQRSAYESASLVVADGWPLVAAARLFRLPLPERVAGSDLVPTLMLQWDRRYPLRVYLLGAAPGVAESAAENMLARCKSIEICGTYSPPLGFERNPAESERIVKEINQVRPDLLVVGLGAPKQEIWLHRYAKRLDAKVAIAAGGTIDFMAGEQQRAPLWVQRIGFEWLHRLVSDPRRLAGRYLYDAWKFPLLVLEEFKLRKLSKSERSPALLSRSK